MNKRVLNLVWCGTLLALSACTEDQLFQSQNSLGGDYFTEKSDVPFQDIDGATLEVSADGCLLTIENRSDVIPDSVTIVPDDDLRVEIQDGDLAVQFLEETEELINRILEVYYSDGDGVSRRIQISVVFDVDCNLSVGQPSGGGGSTGGSGGMTSGSGGSGSGSGSGGTGGGGFGSMSISGGGGGVISQ